MTLRRRLALALLVLAVALVHRWLLAPPDAQPGQRGARTATPMAAVQVRRLEAPDAAAAMRTPAPNPPNTVPHTAPNTAPTALPHVRLPRAAADEAQPRPVAERATKPMDAPAEREPATAAAAAADGATGADAAASATTAIAATAARDAARAQTLPPAPPPAQDVRLRYRVTRGDAVGEGALVFARDADGGYVLTLHAQVPGMAELDWQSTGRITPEGLAPLRLVERKRGRASRAVNFQRDKSLISYSGPTRTDPLRPGAQDRLSLLLHLPALVRARPDAVDWVVQVAAPGGSADVWRFAVRTEPDATVLTREPERPYDWRLALTLAATAPQWPLRMVWTLVPGGQPIEWTALPAS